MPPYSYDNRLKSARDLPPTIPKVGLVVCAEKDEEGTITRVGICTSIGGPVTLHDKVSVAAAIEAGKARFRVIWSPNNKDFIVGPHVNAPKGQYLRTDANKKEEDNLDPMQSCKGLKTMPKLKDRIEDLKAAFWLEFVDSVSKAESDSRTVPAKPQPWVVKFLMFDPHATSISPEADVIKELAKNFGL